jgi:hypothetical protein
VYRPWKRGRPVDRQNLDRIARGLGTLIGEILEDHADLALRPGALTREWPDRLVIAGEVVAILALAIAIVLRRSDSGRLAGSPGL